METNKSLGTEIYEINSAAHRNPSCKERTIVSGGPQKGGHRHAVVRLDGFRRPAGTGGVHIDPSRKLRMEGFEALVVDPDPNPLAIISLFPYGKYLDGLKDPVLRRIEGIGKMVFDPGAGGLRKGFLRLAIVEAVRPERGIGSFAFDVLGIVKAQTVGRAPVALALEAFVAIVVEGFAVGDGGVYRGKDRRRRRGNHAGGH